MKIVILDDIITVKCEKVVGKTGDRYWE